MTSVAAGEGADTRTYVVPALAVLALALALLCDLVLRTVELPYLVQAVFDEPAHVATAVVALLALLPAVDVRRRATFVAAAVAASVLIDVDHVPLTIFHTRAFTAGTERPYSHSLLTVVLLLLLAALARGRARSAVLGVAFGVTVHLLRDTATGPGIPALWPFWDASARVPYPAYAVVLVTLVLVTSLRAARGVAPRV